MREELRKRMREAVSSVNVRDLAEPTLEEKAARLVLSIVGDALAKEFEACASGLWNSSDIARKIRDLTS